MICCVPEGLKPIAFVRSLRLWLISLVGRCRSDSRIFYLDLLLVVTWIVYNER